MLVSSDNKEVGGTATEGVFDSSDLTLPGKAPVLYA